MSESTPPSGSGGATQKVLTLRLDEDVKAQLEVLAQINDRSLTEETRAALESWVEASRSDPKLRERAEQVRAEIEREANTKRNAIALVLGLETPPLPGARTPKQAQT